ncbi:hypothetical protein RND71_040281 [Anisodus tanguticus]|uniref:Uncharacterized protein n=1 Tax=Anisodus tanguticus TaxID=243964 RepID=A0AAE1QRV9_9SOLA|nr:hypothetical protein RND71_040281 [Anisodus tanguticus]
MEEADGAFNLPAVVSSAVQQCLMSKSSLLSGYTINTPPEIILFQIGSGYID